VALTLADPHALSIDGLRIDPLAGPPASSDPWLQPPAYAGPDFRLVQLHGPPRAQDLDALRDGGVRPVRYLAPFSYIVWASAAQLDALRARSGEVRWAGALLPAQRVPPQSRSQDPAPVRAMALVDAASADTVIAALAATGANLVKRAAFTGDLTLVELDLAGAAMLSAAGTPGVYTLQRIAGDAGPRSEISNQSVVGNYNASQIAFPGYQNWLSQTGLTGNGVTVSIVDGGIRTTHVDLAGAMVPCTGSNGSCTAFADNHGTHVAGAVAGRGSSGVLDVGGFLRGQGVAPGASLVTRSISSPTFPCSCSANTGRDWVWVFMGVLLRPDWTLCIVRKQDSHATCKRQWSSMTAVTQGHRSTTCPCRALSPSTSQWIAGHARCCPNSGLPACTGFACHCK